MYSVIIRNEAIYFYPVCAFNSLTLYCWIEDVSICYDDNHDYHQMKREKQLDSIKCYTSHLKRLANIRQEAVIPKDSDQTLSGNLQKSRKHSRARRAKKTIIPNKNVPLSLPLVSQTERELIAKSLSVCKVPHRDAEILLENYLLNKRLLQAKPSIKKLDHDKYYQRHEKYSHLRSRSKLEEIKLSQSRLLKFKEFQEAQRRRIGLRMSSMGAGKYVFTLKITSFQRIYRKQAKNVLYNLILTLGKKSFTYKQLSVRSLAEARSFHFRKKDLKFPNLLHGELEEVIENESKQIGSFTIDLNDAYNKLSVTQKTSEFRFERQEEVEGITSKRNQLLIGTITFNYSIFKQIS